jgi:GNAT superfamily N-acetyltransferase
MFPPPQAGVNPTPQHLAILSPLIPKMLRLRIALAQWGCPPQAIAMTPRRVTDPAEWPAILALLRDAFGYMEGRIDPPSSLAALTAGSLTAQTATSEIWILGAPVACVFLTPKPQALYIGKLAVAASHRGQGLARRLIDQAEMRARDLRLPTLELQTRIELTENQAAFIAMGFVETGRTAHPGYDRPTSITYRRAVAV